MTGKYVIFSGRIDFVVKSEQYAMVEVAGLKVYCDKKKTKLLGDLEKAVGKIVEVSGVEYSGGRVYLRSLRVLDERRLRRELGELDAAFQRGVELFEEEVTQAFERSFQIDAPTARRWARERRAW